MEEHKQYNLQDKEKLPVKNLREFGGKTFLENGEFESPNFSKGSRGWQIDKEGNVEFNNGIFRGTFNVGGTSITINNSEDIQENLDNISTAGGGTLFLQNGIYLLTADISIPSGVRLEGVSRDGVIINCNASYKVNMSGSDVYSTGTVTINNGDTTVVGSSTVWTSAMVGRHILLDGLYYEITAFTDTTHITIETYNGVNLAGSTYVLATINDNSSLSKLTITGATAVGLSVQYSQEPNLFDVIIYGNGTGIDMDYVMYPRIVATANENGVNLNMNYVEGFYIDFSEFSLSTTGAGIIMTNTRNATFFNTSANDNTGNGITGTDCSLIAFISFDISGNGADGVNFTTCNDCQLADGLFDGNVSDGIQITTSDRNTFSAVVAKNNTAYGIRIADSDCNNNILIGVNAESNTSGSLLDNGTGTLKSTTVNILP